MRSYQAYLDGKRREHGEKFDFSELTSKFVPFFESGDRIKVRSPYGTEYFGRVGVTTGWRPVFLLIHNSRSLGSSTILTDEWKVLAVKSQRTGKYRVLSLAEGRNKQ